MAGSSEGSKRLCDLPDAILIHILSFLPTELVVSTSLLSRRWRYLWTSTPNLQLHEFLFNFGHDKFMTFVERALVLRAGSTLVSFSLSCAVKNDESRISTLITSAIQHNVEQLSLHLCGYGYEGSFILPFCIFGCQSLVKLDLLMRICIKVPSIICLPSLKHLALNLVEFADNESAERLLSHPMLEELILCSCTWYNVTAVNVNSPKLQSLEIEDEDEDEDWSEERQVCFFGDNLKFFRYEGFLPPTQYCICGTTMQLKEAVFFVRKQWHEVHNMDGPCNRYCNLVNTLYGVQNLTLSEDTAKSLYLLSKSQWLQTTLPVFDRLTQLNLQINSNAEAISLDRKCLAMLYKRCPNLEHINFVGMISLNSPMEHAPILRIMPSCFRTHLKKVTIQIYERERDDESDNHVINRSCYQDALNLLFNIALVLEEVVIHWVREDFISDQVSTVEKFERKLNACPKVSKNCRVSVILVDNFTMKL